MLPKLQPKKSLLVLCDIQEIFITKIFKMSALINSTNFLISACSHLKIPLVVSQQYSKAFGPTCAGIQTIVDKHYNKNYMSIEKRQFSLYTGEFANFIMAHKDIENIILTGIETHICILNSALDFKRNGLNVYLVADATSSQREYDRKMALDRLQHAGVFLTTAESIIYELVGTSEEDNFKKILGEVKARYNESGFE